MTQHVKVGGVWKQVSSPQVKVSGSWKAVSQGWTKVNGNWKLFHNPSISTSYSGITTGPSMPFTNMRALTSDGENFYAIRDLSPYNQLYKSIGGGPWYLHTTMSTGGNHNTFLAYGNGVLISNSGYYSTNGGTTWTVSPSSVRPTSYGRVQYSNGKFFGSVANAGTGTGAVVSSDGINWTFYSGNTQGTNVGYHVLTSYDLVYTGQRYVSGYGGSISHSTDFINWTLSSGSTPGSGFGITGFKDDSNGKIIITEVTTGGIYTSNDHGVSFSVQSQYSGNYPYSLIYANGYWIMLHNGTLLKWSTNGISWTSVTNALPTSSIWRYSAYAKNLGKWIAFPDSSTSTVISV